FLSTLVRKMSQSQEYMAFIFFNVAEVQNPGERQLALTALDRLKLFQPDVEINFLASFFNLIQRRRDPALLSLVKEHLIDLFEREKLGLEYIELWQLRIVSQFG